MESVDRLRVLLVDDHPLMLEGIRRALEGEKDFEIVGEATSGAQVLSLLSHTPADVVLLDLRLPDVDGLTCLELIQQRHPSTKVIMLSVIAEPSAGPRPPRARASRGPGSRRALLGRRLPVDQVLLPDPEEIVDEPV